MIQKKRGAPMLMARNHLKCVVKNLKTPEIEIIARVDGIFRVNFRKFTLFFEKTK